MRIFLNGGGDGEKCILVYNKLNEIIDHTKPILYIPIAMEKEKYNGCKQWIDAELKEIEVPYIEMVTSGEELVNKDLYDYSAVFIGGGNTYKLLYELKQSNSFEKINDYIRNNGIVFGGSAGAIIFGYDLESCLCDDENEVRLQDTKGFDVLNGVSILCHYTNRSEEKIKYNTDYLLKLSPRRKVVALPEEDTIFINDDDIEIIGSKDYYLFEDGTYKKNINLNTYKNIELLIIQEKLGNIVRSIDIVVGGLSHRMYKVVTDKEVYAVKELNAGVMKRPDAYDNFIFSEKVTDIAKQNSIDAVGAIKLQNDIMKQINNQYFMVFNWLDGKILKAEEINKIHCEIIGKVLAEIHNTDFNEIEDKSRKKFEVEEFKWDKYIDIAEEQNKKYSNLLKENIKNLHTINNKSNEALKYANSNLIISHTDLDRKNVMWQGDKPFIIDWEASGYINPTIELIQVAWYWAGGDIENIDYEKFETVVNAYKKYSNIEIDKNVEKLIYADIYNGLAWLNYNLKRSLCIENEYEIDEIELAENEVIQSIGEINYNISQIDNMLKILKK